MWPYHPVLIKDLARDAGHKPEAEFDWQDQAMKLCSRDGRFVVEVIKLADSGEWLRVTEHGFVVGQVRTPQELEKLGIKIEDLREEALAHEQGAAPVGAFGSTLPSTAVACSSGR